MARLIAVEPTKTYATRENAIKAFEKKFASADCNYFIALTEDGRYYPVAIGVAAIRHGVNFHFNTIA